MAVAPPELHARVRALARRGTTDPVRLCVGDMELDPMARAARRAGRPLQLTYREFQLLEYLVRHQGAVLTREQICRDLWQGRATPPLDNALDVHIARLRRKVDGDAPVHLIHTIRGVGFAFGERTSWARASEPDDEADPLHALSLGKNQIRQFLRTIQELFRVSPRVPRYYLTARGR